MQIYRVHLQRILVCITLLIIGLQPIYADTKSDASNLAEDTVKQLYRDYAWEAIGLDGVNLSEQSKQSLEKYFESSLANLIIKDNECRERTHDICHLDFNIIFASQDPAAVDLKIFTANGVMARFKYPTTQEIIEIKFIMKKTKSGWRIHDIEYGKGRLTLRKSLD